MSTAPSSKGGLPDDLADGALSEMAPTATVQEDGGAKAASSTPRQPPGAPRLWQGPSLAPLVEAPSLSPPVEAPSSTCQEDDPPAASSTFEGDASSPSMSLADVPSFAPMMDHHIFWAESNLEDGIPVAMSLQVAQRLGLVTVSMYDSFLRNSTLRLQQDIRSTMTLYVTEKKRLQGRLQGLRRDVSQLRPGGSGSTTSSRVPRRSVVRGRVMLPKLEGRAEAEQKLKKLQESELAAEKKEKEKPREKGVRIPLPLEKKEEAAAAAAAAAAGGKDHGAEKAAQQISARSREIEAATSARTKTSEALSTVRDVDKSVSASDKQSSARDKPGAPRLYKRGERRARVEGERREDGDLTDAEEDVFRPVAPPGAEKGGGGGGDDTESIYTTRSTRSHRSKKMVRLPALPPSRLPQWSSGLNIAEKASADAETRAYVAETADFSQSSLRIPEVQDPHRTEIFLPKGSRGLFRARKVTFGHKPVVPRLPLNGESDVETDGETEEGSTRGDPPSMRSRNLSTIQEDEGNRSRLALPKVRPPKARVAIQASRRGGRGSRTSSLNKSCGYDSDRTEASEAFSTDSHDTSDWKSVYSNITDPEKRTQALADILYSVRIRMMENEQSLHYGERPESLDGSIISPRRISKRRPAVSVAGSMGGTSSPERRARRSTALQLQNYLRKMHKQRHLTDSLSRKDFAALQRSLQSQPPQTPSVEVKA